MKIIGITGKQGSGKSTFALLLSQKLNCQHIDIDKISHKSLSQTEIINELCNEFGTEILDNNNSINRKKLGNIVFTQKDKMKILEDLTYSYMQKCLDTILSQDNNFIILEYNLLPRTKYWNKCNFKILVSSDDMQRKNKVIERDNISEEYFNKRDLSSIDYSHINFDYIFENDYNKQNMNKVVENLSKEFMKGEKI